jgi:hypothetical protein
LTGSVNAPIADTHGTLLPELQNAWQQFYTEYPDMRTAEKVKEQYEKLVESDFLLPANDNQTPISYPSFVESE